MSLDSQENNPEDSEVRNLLGSNGPPCWHPKDIQGSLGYAAWFRSPRRPNCLISFSFAANVLFLCMFSAAFAIYSSKKGFFCHSMSLYETGFASDLDAVKPEVELVKLRYSGGVVLPSHGDFTVDPEGQKYVADPSPEVDEAWDSLQDGLNIDLDAWKAGTLKGRTFQWPETGLYFTGLEVFHSLHCLNRLRQALYPEYYHGVFGQPGDPDREIHIGHCTNHLRQAIQCHSDLTPMEWTLVDGHRIVLSTSTEHTCRNFEKIHTWAMQRQTRFQGISSVQNGSLWVVD